MPLKILYVEDDDGQRELVTDLIKKNKYEIHSSPDPVNALKLIENNDFDLIISDFRMPEMNGDEFFEKVKNINPFISFILVTAYGDINLAVSVMKSGAVDFITKPFNFDLLLEKIKEIEKKRFINNEIDKIKDNNNMELKKFPGLIGNSKEFNEVIAKIPRIAKTEISVLINGESGTGKEIIADLIQMNSNRANMPYIKINCSAIPDNLIESELFGYEKGAFTGANKSKKGQIEVADNGTLFLDEIGELPYQLQSKLLRFLQNSEIQKIGSREINKVNVRVISATNQNLQNLIKENKFREDLFFRLNVVNIQLPPLRKRKEDIPDLIDFFLKKYIEKNNTKEKVFSKAAINKLVKYSFPGNIRELENIVQNALIFSLSNVIEADDIPIISNDRTSSETDEYNIPEDVVDMTEFVNNIEKQLIIKALERNNWNQSKASRDLNITLRILRYKMDKYEIKN